MQAATLLELANLLFIPTIGAFIYVFRRMLIHDKEIALLQQLLRERELRQAERHEELKSRLEHIQVLLGSPGKPRA